MVLGRRIKVKTVNLASMESQLLANFVIDYDRKWFASADGTRESFEVPETLRVCSMIAALLTKTLAP